MRYLTPIAFSAALMSDALMFGQGMTLVSSTLPLMRVAPGEIVTLYVTGAKTVLPSSVLFQAYAKTVPLPLSIAGFSVTIRNGYNGTFNAPLLAVGQTPLCQTDRTSPCILTSLTVQIPWEITPPPVDPPFNTEVIINDNGTPSEPFLVGVDFDHLQTVKTCGASPSFACVTHADGSTVTAAAPARPGEVVVVYALGLGPVSPAPKTGDATPIPAPTLGTATVNSSVAIEFDFRPDAAPSRPFVHPTIKSPGVTGPIFVGLTPGQVGLYQINLKLPESFPAVPPCTAVTSNLTIDIGYLLSPDFVDSYDGAAICVEPPQ